LISPHYFKNFKENIPLLETYIYEIIDNYLTTSIMLYADVSTLPLTTQKKPVTQSL